MSAANETPEYRLKESRVIKGQIEVVTGLRIGANVEQMEISGLDNPILRNPLTDEPYIPGSSLKGKMRSLSEWYHGKLPDRGNPTKPDPDTPTARVFGIPATEQREVGPTRTLVRDAVLSGPDCNRFNGGEAISEIKTENSINRLTAMANPRPMERVLPEVRFDFEIVYRIFDMGDGGQADEGNFESVLLTAMALLEQDYLGSCGSRGCGQIRFVVPDGEGTKPGIRVDGTHRELPGVAAQSTGQAG